MAIHFQSALNNLTIAQWSLLFLASTFTMSMALTPSTLIALISGYFLGWQALFYILLSYPTASLIGFMLGKQLDNGQLINSLPLQSNARLALVELKNHHWLMMVLVRISPVLPFSLMNLILPAIKVPLKVFLIAGLAGMLPRTLASLWIGIQARDLVYLLQHPTQNNLPMILMVAGTTISVVGIVYIGQKIIAEILLKKGLSD
ncbi:VTT domain-containing protein [uncultured Endozoicomonas sp.]|uniref:TVP38/TMEM64 family protein n=1 Tax=uncultured Endozoicomonas sp. TaxID=432652 RepID=UPI002610165C|nr:VTT domain-containing protein [uncultured Endozoicomonas sp.]